MYHASYPAGHFFVVGREGAASHCDVFRIDRGDNRLLQVTDRSGEPGSSLGYPIACDPAGRRLYTVAQRPDETTVLVDLGCDGLEWQELVQMPLLMVTALGVGPGGKVLFMVGFPGASSDRRGIYRVEDETLSELVPPGRCPWEVGRIAVHPSGEFLVAAGDREQLLRCDAKTGRMEPFGDNQGIDPCWSPDGRYLAYAGQHGIVICDADGSAQRQRTFIHLDRNPCWSPDGRFVAFTFGEPALSGTLGLCVLQAGGGGVRRYVFDGRMDPHRRFIITTCVWTGPVDAAGMPAIPDPLDASAERAYVKVVGQKHEEAARLLDEAMTRDADPRLRALRADLREDLDNRTSAALALQALADEELCREDLWRYTAEVPAIVSLDQLDDLKGALRVAAGMHARSARDGRRAEALRWIGYLLRQMAAHAHRGGPPGLARDLLAGGLNALLQARLLDEEGFDDAASREWDQMMSMWARYAPGEPPEPHVHRAQPVPPAAPNDAQVIIRLDVLEQVAELQQSASSQGWRETVEALMRSERSAEARYVASQMPRS